MSTQLKKYGNTVNLQGTMHMKRNSCCVARKRVLMATNSEGLQQTPFPASVPHVPHNVRPSQPRTKGVPWHNRPLPDKVKFQIIEYARRRDEQVCLDENRLHECQLIRSIAGGQRSRVAAYHAFCLLTVWLVHWMLDGRLVKARVFAQLYEPQCFWERNMCAYFIEDSY